MERLKTDMTSDSWLSKNVRPLSLIFLTVAVTALAYGTIFNSELTEAQQSALDVWVPFFTMLMLTVYGFYFGSRGLEKIQKVRSGSTAHTAQHSPSGSIPPVGKNGN